MNNILERDIKSVKSLLVELDAGWSINVSKKRSGLTEKEYQYLKKSYPLVREIVAIHSQAHKRQKWD